MSTCATLPCADVDECCLEGGCIRVTHPGQQTHELAAARQHAREAEGLRRDAPALNGTKPREVRDPVLMKRKRKAIQR